MVETKKKTKTKKTAQEIKKDKTALTKATVVGSLQRVMSETQDNLDLLTSKDVEKIYNMTSKVYSFMDSMLSKKRRDNSADNYKNDFKTYADSLMRDL